MAESEAEHNIIALIIQVVAGNQLDLYWAALLEQARCMQDEARNAMFCDGIIGLVKGGEDWSWCLWHDGYAVIS